MERSRKVKIFTSSLVVLFVLSFGIMYAVLNNKNGDVEEEQVLGTTNEESILDGVEDTYGTPYIVSSAPLAVVEGELYEYFLRVEDTDSDYGSLSIELVDGPDWLVAGDMLVSGVAPYESGQTFQYTVRVSDGTNSSSQKNYILVTKAGE